MLVVAESVAKAPTPAKPGNKAKSITILKKMTDSMEKNKKAVEDKLFQLYKKSTIAKIESLRAAADADYAEQVVASSERLLKSLELYTKLEQRNLGLDFLYGKLPDHPGKDCADIKKKFKSAQSGVFYLSDSTEKAVFKTKCDLTHVGGGWTKFAIKGSNFNVDTLKDKKMALNRDLNREAIVEDMNNDKEFNTLSLDRFDKTFGVNFELLIEVRDNQSDETPEFIQIISNKKSVTTPSTVSEGLLSQWKIEKGTHCNIVPEVGRACRVNADGSPLAKAAAKDIVPMATTNYVALYIRP